MVLLMLISGCKPQQAPQSAPAPTVKVISPQWITDDPVVTLTGTVEASEQVTLTARVSGTLQQINFRDGDRVEAGQLLFAIEDDSYQAQLRADQAALDEAQRNLQRQQVLKNRGAVAQSTLDDARSTRDQALAQRDISRINLSYTRIAAPFSGRIGQRQVDTGNLVGQSGNTELATLNRISPLYVSFTLDQTHASELGLTAADSQQAPRLPVEVVAPGSEQRYRATLDFIDNQFDSASGSLALRITLNSTDKQLIPGMFVQVLLHKHQPRKTLQIPRSAVWQSDKGPGILIVDQQQRVTHHAVKLAPASGENVTLLQPQDAGLQLLATANPALEGQQIRRQRQGAPHD